jgi:SAM-dependent methyltransferase
MVKAVKKLVRHWRLMRKAPAIRAELDSILKKRRDDKSTIKKLTKQVAEQQQQIRDLEELATELFIESRGFVLLPPPELRLHVGRVTDAINFWWQGRNSSRRVVEVFGENPKGFVLDWGCGSGRTLHWLMSKPGWKTAYRGCDVDPEAIAWLRDQGFGNVEVCPDLPPLPYEDATFDGLFNFSVLTHIHPDRHRAWYQEMHRVLKKGGRAYVTVQGDQTILNGKSYVEGELETYRKQGWLFSEREGHYKHSAVVSEAFSRACIGDLFEIEHYAQAGYARMDDFILRKR